jgi:RNA polymerase sigma-70 factor (ECF subfamily)
MADMFEEASLAAVDLPESLDFETFFRGEYPRLCRALVLLVGDASEAEDLAQESMTRVLERWIRVREMESPIGYVYRTALNLQRKRIRRLAVRARRVFADVPAPDPVTAADDRHDVRRALASLPASQRAALVLVDWIGMDAGEAAGLLGITAGSLRVRLHRGRMALRTVLGDRHE